MPDYTIPNLRNACRILDCLAHSEQPLSSAEIADKLEIPRSTTLRILFTLEAQQFVRKVGKQITLGSALIPLGNKAQKSLSIRELAGPILQRITEATGETSHLALLSIDKVLIMEVCNSPHPLSANSPQGATADLHCSATGKTLLAYMDETERDVLLDRIDYTIRTKNTLPGKQKLLTELVAIRKQGYAIDEQEYHEGIRCIATPVFDAQGVVVYSIGITAAASRFTKAKIKPYAERLQGHSEELTRLLGGRIPRV